MYAATGSPAFAGQTTPVGAVAADILALAGALDAGPVHVVGNSMAAGAAVIAAARKPEAIRSLTLVGPFVRDMLPPWVASALFGPLMVAPWGPALWRMLYKKSFPTRPPDDFDAEVARRHANLMEPGRLTALRRMLLASKTEAERSASAVVAPALVLMGSRDTDFPNPAKEAQHVAGLVHGRVAMIEGAGHYPQAEMPDAFAAQLLPFLRHAS